MGEEKNGKLFVSRQDWHFCFNVVITEVLYLICTLTWRVKIFVSRQRKGLNRKNEGTKLVMFCTDDNE